MKQFPFLLALGLCLYCSGGALGQSAQQTIAISVLGAHQRSDWLTNAASLTTNETAHVPTLVFSSANIAKAIEIDLYGFQWTNWEGSFLLRKIDLTTGAEGIFLRKPTGTDETNVSEFFGDSFSNNFTENVGAVVGGFSNLTYISNGVETDITNAAYWGGFIFSAAHGTVTNKIRSTGLFAVSFNSSNLKFNLLMYGATVETNLVADYEGTNYSRWIPTLLAGGIGNFAVNLGTNLFFETNLFETTNFVSGPAHGTINCYDTVFSRLPGP